MLAGLKYSHTQHLFDCICFYYFNRCGDNSRHPEHGGRLQSVWARLLETGLASRCSRLRARKATLDELRLCHTDAHTLMFGKYIYISDSFAYFLYKLLYF